MAVAGLIEDNKVLMKVLYLTGGTYGILGNSLLVRTKYK